MLREKDLKKEHLSRELKLKGFSYIFVVISGSDICSTYRQYGKLLEKLEAYFESTNDGFYAYHFAQDKVHIERHNTVLLVFRKKHERHVENLVEDIYIGMDPSKTHIKDNISVYKATGYLEQSENTLSRIYNKVKIVFKPKITSIVSHNPKRHPYLNHEFLEKWNIKENLADVVFLDNDACRVIMDDNNYPKLDFKRKDCFNITINAIR